MLHETAHSHSHSPSLSVSPSAHTLGARNTADKICQMVSIRCIKLHRVSRARSHRHAAVKLRRKIKCKTKRKNASHSHGWLSLFVHFPARHSLVVRSIRPSRASALHYCRPSSSSSTSLPSLAVSCSLL